VNHLAHPLSTSLLALALVAVSSAAPAAEPSAAATLFPTPTPFVPSASTLLPSPSAPSALPGLPGDHRPVRLQVDGGEDNLRTVVMMFPSGAPLATMYIFNQSIGSYTTGREYWYVNRNAIAGQLGAAGLTISVSDSSPGSAPPDPGYSPEQKFQQTQSPAGGWGTGWTTDPYSVAGDLYAGPNNTYVRFLVSNGSPASLTWVIWYQVLSSGSPANINPSGSWSAVSGGVPVPSGSLGYYIAQSTD
jgi:hypothetical protein